MKRLCLLIIIGCSTIAALAIGADVKKRLGKKPQAAGAIT